MNKKQILLAGIAVVGMFTSGCTYNTVDYFHYSVTVMPKREPIPIMYKHDDFKQTHHLSKPTRRVIRMPIDSTPLNRKFCKHVCPYCGKEFIPPYHQNHICKKMAEQENKK